MKRFFFALFARPFCAEASAETAVRLAPSARDFPNSRRFISVLLSYCDQNLKRQLGSQLNHAAVGGRSNDAIGGRPHGRAWEAEVDSVEGVKELGADLESHRLAESHTLEQRHIH